VYNTGIAALFAAMDVHKAHVEFQHIAFKLLESMFLNTETVGSIFNFNFISSILVALQVHTETVLCLQGIEVLFQKMSCAPYRKHMVDNGAIVVALMLLKNTTNLLVAQKTMSFLSCFEAPDLNSQLAGTFVQSLTRHEKKLVCSQLTSTKDIVQNACARFPQTCFSQNVRWKKMPKS